MPRKDSQLHLHLFLAALSKKEIIPDENILAVFVFHQEDDHGC